MQRYESLDFEGAAAATEGLERCRDGSAAELADAFRWRAQALAGGGDSGRAAEVFALVEVIVPGYALDPFLSPKLHELQRAGRAQAKSSRPVFARLLPTEESGGERQLLVEVFDAEKSHSATFRFFLGERTRELPGVPVGDRHFRATVPREATADDQVEVMVHVGARLGCRTPRARIDPEVEVLHASAPPDALAPAAPAPAAPARSLQLAAAPFAEVVSRRVGAELAVSVALGPSFEVGAAVTLGSYPGLRLAASLHRPRTGALIEPLVQARLAYHPWPGAVGVGALVGATAEAGPGRILAGVVGERYFVPAGFLPYAVMAVAGYQLDLLTP